MVLNNNNSLTHPVNTSRFFPHSWLITGLARLTRRVSLVEEELSTLPEHLSSPPVHVTRSLVLYICLVDRCLSFCTFSLDHCFVCSPSIYGFWLPPFGIRVQTSTVYYYLMIVLCISFEMGYFKSGIFVLIKIIIIIKVVFFLEITTTSIDLHKE